jgi:hypothetical protein
MQELIKKVVDIFDIEYLMKIEREKGEEMTRELSDLMDQHLAMNEALPHQDTVNLAPMVTGMARQLSILRRLTAGLDTLEAELKVELENVSWKRTNGKESRSITAKRAAIEEKKEAITAKQKDVAKYQTFFEYIDDTDRHIAELEDAAAGRRISPRIQAQIDADWEAKKADIKRSYEEYEKSLKDQKHESTV